MGAPYMMDKPIKIITSIVRVDKLWADPLDKNIIEPVSVVNGDTLFTREGPMMIVDHRNCLVDGDPFTYYRGIYVISYKSLVIPPHGSLSKVKGKRSDVLGWYENPIHKAQIMGDSSMWAFRSIIDPFVPIYKYNPAKYDLEILNHIIKGEVQNYELQSIYLATDERSFGRGRSRRKREDYRRYFGDESGSDDY